MIRIIALLLFLVSSVSAITKQELGVLNAVSSKYFKDDGVHYYLQYMKGKPQEKMYEFTYMKWKAFPIQLTQADRRNEITKRMHVKLVCDTAYRVKANNKWSPWKQGGAYQLNWFNGQIIHNKSGISYVPNTPSMLKYYSKPGEARSAIIPIRKTPNNLPPGVTRIPRKK